MKLRLFSPMICRLQAEEVVSTSGDVIQSESEGLEPGTPTSMGGRNDVLLKRETSPSFCLSFLFGPSVDGMTLATLVRVIFFTQSTGSKVNLSGNTLTDTLKMFF